MRRTRTGRSGFTLIELMITVAIIGILASIAIPGFQRMQLRGKIGEGRTNLAAIRTAENSYYSEFNAYQGIAATPGAVPGLSKVAWPNPNPFDAIGWAPEGSVHFQYLVAVPGGGGAQFFTAEAASDLDADLVNNVWGYVKVDLGGNSVAGGLLCPATGVWDPLTNTPTLFDTVGPCDGVSGNSVF